MIWIIDKPAVETGGWIRQVRPPSFPHEKAIIFILINVASLGRQSPSLLHVVESTQVVNMDRKTFVNAHFNRA